jgi:hypothetical protein
LPTPSHGYALDKSKTINVFLKLNNNGIPGKCQYIETQKNKKISLEGSKKAMPGGTA